MLRDPTRGGLAASLNEIAAASNCGIVIEEASLPINPTVQSACEILGLDPLLVANEGKLVCIVPAESANGVLEAMKSIALGAAAAVIGTVVADHPGMVIAKTPIGASRVITVPDRRTTSPHLLNKVAFSSVGSGRDHEYFVRRLPANRILSDTRRRFR